MSEIILKVNCITMEPALGVKRRFSDIRVSKLGGDILVETIASYRPTQLIDVTTVENDRAPISSCDIRRCFELGLCFADEHFLCVGNITMLLTMRWLEIPEFLTPATFLVNQTFLQLSPFAFVVHKNDKLVRNTWEMYLGVARFQMFDDCSHSNNFHSIFKKKILKGLLFCTKIARMRKRKLPLFAKRCLRCLYRWFASESP